MVRERTLTFLSLIIIIPIGFYTKFYRGPAFYWINNYLSGIFYVLFWCLVIFFLIPRTRPVKIAFWVFIVTALLEFIQLWHPPFLEMIRSTFIGVTIIGRSFAWADFIYYAVGSFIAWLWMNWIQKSS